MDRAGSYEPFIERLARTKKLCIVHIPKTGGSTLIDGLRTALGDRAHALYGEHWRATFRRLSPGQFAEAGPMVVSGHFSYGEFRAALTDDFAYLSLVRDPLDRLISYYRYSQVTQTDNPIARAAKSHDFGDFLRFVEGHRRRIVRNQQTRSLSPTVELTSRRNPRFRTVRRGLQDHKILVAPTTRCDWLTPLISTAMETPIEARRSKVSDATAVVTPTADDLAFIKANNRQDRKLFDWAAARAHSWV